MLCHLICMNDILMDREAWDVNSLISSLRLQSWSCCLTPCAPAATAGSARRLPCSCSMHSHCSPGSYKSYEYYEWGTSLHACPQETLKPLFFSNTFDFSSLRTQFYGKRAEGTCATHQGNRSPNKIMIFMAFAKNTDSQNTVPSIGFQLLFIHIFVISITVT